MTAQVRAFNRFYTKKIGVLQEHLLSSDFSLTEVRIMFELFHKEDWTARELTKELALDEGYLSRILNKLQKQNLIKKTKSKDDARTTHLNLTPNGRTTFEGLNQETNDQIKALLAPLPAPAQVELARSMATIQTILSDTNEKPTLRSPRPGDMGWVTYRHGVLYDQEYGWGNRFEALVAQVVASYVDNFDPKKDRAWIADLNQTPIGSIFLVQSEEDETVAKLRLFLVEPSARGKGAGRLLLNACIAFAKEAGYKRIDLWTNRGLDAARHLYEEAGFELKNEAPHTLFGQGLIGQTWSLDLK